MRLLYVFNEIFKCKLPILLHDKNVSDRRVLIQFLQDISYREYTKKNQQQQTGTNIINLNNLIGFMHPQIFKRFK